MTSSNLQEAEPSVTRRRFLACVGWGSLAAFWGSIVLATLRFLFPRILYEPSPMFQAGKPADYQIGEVSGAPEGPQGMGADSGWLAVQVTVEAQHPAHQHRQG